MPRRPATITQADVARTLRAAKAAGAGKVEVRPDGSLIIHLDKSEPVASDGGLSPFEKWSREHAGAD